MNKKPRVVVKWFRWKEKPETQSKRIRDVKY